MSGVSHLDIFYETRSSVHVSNSSPANSPNTELTETPIAAELRFKDGQNRTLDAEEYDAPNNKGFKTARFLIERAMHDPDAVVIPLNK